MSNLAYWPVFAWVGSSCPLFCSRARSRASFLAAQLPIPLTLHLAHAEHDEGAALLPLLFLDWHIILGPLLGRLVFLLETQTLDGLAASNEIGNDFFGIDSSDAPV